MSDDERDLAALFRGRPADEGAPADAFRERVFAASLPAIRRRGRLRAARQAAALLLVFAAGLATGRLSAPADAERATRGLPVAEAGPGRGPERHASGGAEARAGAAAARPDSLSERLKALGDRRLEQACDVEGALHLYRQHLELESRNGPIAPADGDSWLLAALKSDQRR
jgi:hypothetical protein